MFKYMFKYILKYFTKSKTKLQIAKEQIGNQKIQPFEFNNQLWILSCYGLIPWDTYMSNKEYYDKLPSYEEYNEMRLNDEIKRYDQRY